MTIVEFERDTELVKGVQDARVVIFRGAIHHEAEQRTSLDPRFAEESDAVTALVQHDSRAVREDKVRPTVLVEQRCRERDRLSWRLGEGLLENC